ncbi:MAG: molybdopterin molybdenumtransferase MoeA, partial [Cellvibrionaceae bacterium]|nr:molybdopterin molybdenumtransferase MoeA [Cellvibrionaceae bacterium]
FVMPAPINIRKRPGRTDFQRATLSQGESGQWQIQMASSQSSGMLSSLSRANCYIKLGRERADVEAGEMIEVIPFDRWLI